MAVGQQVLSPVVDTEAMMAANARVTGSVSCRSAAYAEQLRAVLDVDRVFTDAGLSLSSIAQVALLLQLPERSAFVVLEQARLLSRLEGALEALEIGLLTVEQARALVDELDGRDPVVQDRVWEQLTVTLLANVSAGVVMPRARLVEWLRRRVIAADPQDAIPRRQTAQRDTADVEYRRRDDGLTDILGLGLSSLNARAVLQRIRDRAGSFGAEDSRSVGQRRMEAFTDMLLGRDQLPLAPVDDDNPFHQVQGHCGVQCGCRLGEPVPCGLGVTLLVPLGAALRTTGELAELQGHGPIEPDLLAAALANAPVVRVVHVDDRGVPVGVGQQTVSPARRDPVALRQALLHLAGAPPGPPHPRHPDDHPSPSPVSDPAAQPTNPTRSPGGSLRPARRDKAHPADTPGPYRPGRRLQRLLRARSPRCEWPACGAAAVRCDLDHDVAHPAGPTCACNLGPLCRRHHRCKQQLMSKQRTADGVCWTDPTGRVWLSPNQHLAPQPAVRPMPLLLLVDPDHDHPDDEDGSTDLDPIRLELRATDPFERTAEQHDDLEWAADQRRVQRLIHPDGYAWEAALDDPTRWEPHPDA